jgi:ribosome maturation factor RimP
MNISMIKQRIYEIAKEIAENEGYELVNVDLVGGRKLLLRVTIDKEGGITINDCERMSRTIESVLDVEDLIKGPYVLEVSSPGIDRPLLKQSDFVRNINRLVKIITKEKIDNQNFFIGRIIDVGDGWIRVRLQKKKGEKDIFIPIDKISTAKLEVEF